MADSSNSRTASRRLFLASGAAVAVFGSLHAAAAAPLQGLIDAHSAAHVAFTAVCDFDDYVEPDDAHYQTASAEYHARRDAEDAAMMALCTYRPTSMQEVHARGDYLVRFSERNGFAPEESDALLMSFRS